MTRVGRLEDALREIEKGEGPYDRDPLEHAGNCIDSMKAIARKALAPPVATFDEEAYAEIRDALAILSAAKGAALARIIVEANDRGRVFDAIETFRWVANTFDHLSRASRLALGLDERGDPCLPSW